MHAGVYIQATQLRPDLAQTAAAAGQFLAQHLHHLLRRLIGSRPTGQYAGRLGLLGQDPELGQAASGVSVVHSRHLFRAVGAVRLVGGQVGVKTASELAIEFFDLSFGPWTGRLRRWLGCSLGRYVPGALVLPVGRYVIKAKDSLVAHALDLLDVVLYLFFQRCQLVDQRAEAGFDLKLEGVDLGQAVGQLRLSLDEVVLGLL